MSRVTYSVLEFNDNEGTVVLHLNDESAAMGGDPTSKGGQIIQKFGERIRKVLTKFWIWIVTITLFAIGITGTKMTLFRIMYTALALIFIVTFQVRDLNLVFFFCYCKRNVFDFINLLISVILGYMEKNDVRFLVDGDYHLDDYISHDIHVPIRRYRPFVGKYRNR